MLHPADFLVRNLIVLNTLYLPTPIVLLPDGLVKDDVSGSMYLYRCLVHTCNVAWFTLQSVISAQFGVVRVWMSPSLHGGPAPSQPPPPSWLTPSLPPLPGPLSDESLYEVSVLQERRDMWRVYLQQQVSERRVESSRVRGDLAMSLIEGRRRPCS